MDEETADTTPGSTTDPQPGFSGNSTIIKPKKAAPAKKKTDKDLAPAKKTKDLAPAKKTKDLAPAAKKTKDLAPDKKKVDKDLAPAKKAKKEIVPSKVADKAAAVPSKKANKEAVPTKKVNKEATRSGPQPEKKTTTLDLVCEAIEILGDSKKGLSVQAIKKYIKSKKDSEPSAFNTLVNKALKKGIEKGVLERPPASKDFTGAVGFFRLGKIAPPKRIVKEARKKTDSEHASDSEATVKPIKPRKRNLSDSMLIDMKASSTPKPPVKEAALKNAKRVKKVAKKNPNDRKDTSDSEIVVKKTGRKSLKSYSSDTEVDFQKSKISKAAKSAKAGSPPKVSKAKVKKLYNNNDETVTISGKPRAKRHD